MRNVRFDHWLAGTMLAVVTGAATATPSFAAPDGIRQVAPLPPSLNGARIIHRRPDPMPEPPPAPVRNTAEQPVRTPDHVEVSVRDGVERSRDEGHARVAH